MNWQITTGRIPIDRRTPHTLLAGRVLEVAKEEAGFMPPAGAAAVIEKPGNPHSSITTFRSFKDAVAGSFTMEGEQLIRASDGTEYLVDSPGCGEITLTRTK